jgi:hypothetical protein
MDPDVTASAYTFQVLWRIVQMVAIPMVGIYRNGLPAPIARTWRADLPRSMMRSGPANVC